MLRYSVSSFSVVHLIKVSSLLVADKAGKEELPESP